MIDRIRWLFRHFTDSCFRLEALQHYDLPDDERWIAWRKGQRALPPPRPDKANWLKFIREAVPGGRRIFRAHVVELPLTEYMHYEFSVYAENIEAGEEVFIVDRATDPSLTQIKEDFTLFDAETDHPAVVLFQYDDSGCLLGRSLSEDAVDIQRCKDKRDLVMNYAVPLSEFTDAETF